MLFAHVKKAPLAGSALFAPGDQLECNPAILMARDGLMLSCHRELAMHGPSNIDATAPSEVRSLQALTDLSRTLQASWCGHYPPVCRASVQCLIDGCAQWKHDSLEKIHTPCHVEKSHETADPEQLKLRTMLLQSHDCLRAVPTPLLHTACRIALHPRIQAFE